jgi:putative peptide-modifying radical SAM enzyme
METDFGDFEVDYLLPSEISYDIGLLRRFCEKDSELVLIFYGGEPMLRIEKIKQIMDVVRARRFVIQTNGLHLNRLEPEYLNRLCSIFVSIDGDEELTDYYRGENVYRRIIENVRLIRRNGFEGEIIARMTVMEETDVYKQIMWLLNNPDYSFSSIHWQLDAGFWKNDFPKRPFAKWVKENYNPGIRRLVKFWLDSMESGGKVLRLYPFLGVMQSLLTGEKSLLRCGSGWINYSIQTDGHIIPCPIMNGMKDYYLGHIRNAHPLHLRKVLVGQPCTSCEILHECGGRCLYANVTKRWSEEAYALVCKTVKNLVESLKAILPRVKELINIGKIRLSDFEYMKYNSCEIIP